jgi:hypothetical protein
MAPVAMQDLLVKIFSSSKNYIACVLKGYQYWQVWDLEQRQIASTLQWDSNITAFSVIFASSYMYEVAILYCISIWNLFISIKGV